MTISRMLAPKDAEGVTKVLSYLVLVRWYPHLLIHTIRFRLACLEMGGGDSVPGLLLQKAP